MAVKSYITITKHSMINLVIFSMIFMSARARLANGQVSEAEQIALESTTELLAPSALTNLITTHLSAIRAKYPQVANVKHQGKWIPGEVLVGGLDAAGVDRIRKSKYGPLKAAKPLLSTYHLVFFRPFNPEKLAKILVKDFSLKYAEPNGSFGTFQTISFVKESTTQYEYTFMKGSGDCPAGCINKHFWVFSVSDMIGPQCRLIYKQNRHTIIIHYTSSTSDAYKIVSHAYSESNISTSSSCQYKSSEKVIKEQINRTKYFKFRNDCD